MIVRFRSILAIVTDDRGHLVNPATTSFFPRAIEDKLVFVVQNFPTSGFEKLFRCYVVGADLTRSKARKAHVGFAFTSQIGNHLANLAFQKVKKKGRVQLAYHATPDVIADMKS